MTLCVILLVVIEDQTRSRSFWTLSDRKIVALSAGTYNDTWGHWSVRLDDTSKHLSVSVLCAIARRYHESNEDYMGCLEHPQSTDHVCCFDLDATKTGCPLSLPVTSLSSSSA